MRYREVRRDCGEGLGEFVVEVVVDMLLFWLLPLEAGGVEHLLSMSRRLPAASFFWSQEGVSR